MTVTAATVGPIKNGLRAFAGASTADDEILYEFAAESFDYFTLHSTAGVMDVEATHDGTNWFLLALDDLTTGSATKVTETTAGSLFGLQGKFYRLRVNQKGLTGVANFSLMAGSISS